MGERARNTLNRPERTLTRCLVCGFGEVRTDEVVDRGLVLLAECPRCDHRWTTGAPAPPSPRAVRVRAGAGALREVVSAA